LVIARADDACRRASLTHIDRSSNIRDDDRKTPHKTCIGGPTTRNCMSALAAMPQLCHGLGSPSFTTPSED
jgi:hypothetical protein